MNSQSLPSLRIKPDLLKAAEQVLHDGESLSSFVESSLRTTVERRLSQKEFIARGLASRDRARNTGQYEDAQCVLEELRQMMI
ncbi:MAG: prevent-host-death protein [Chlorobiaceae bacterium]|nr:prevent-host-death protein [Chlorobiaceae bacterium]